MAVVVSFLIGPEHPVVLRYRFVVSHDVFEQTGARQPFHFRTLLAKSDRFRLRQQDPNDVGSMDKMFAQNGEGVMMARLNEALEFGIYPCATPVCSGCRLRSDRVHFV
jgi:hypothetical protein